MAVTNLTGTKWLWNSGLSGFPYSAQSFNINFTSNGENFTLLKSYDYVGHIPLYYNQTNVYSGTWLNDNYQTIEITGGADVENTSLISLLEIAATQIITPPTFQEDKIALKIYTNITRQEFDVITKEPNSFYIVDNVGIYKGETFIASSKTGLTAEEVNTAIQTALSDSSVPSQIGASIYLGYSVDTSTIELIKTLFQNNPVEITTFAVFNNPFNYYKLTHQSGNLLGLIYYNRGWIYNDDINKVFIFYGYWAEKEYTAGNSLNHYYFKITNYIELAQTTE